MKTSEPVTKIKEINMIDERNTLFCDCHDPFHQVVFDYDPDDDSVAIYQKMSHFLPWWKRLKVAFDYVTGRSVRRIQYTEVYLPLKKESASVRTIRDMLNKVLGD